MYEHKATLLGVMPIIENSIQGVKCSNIKRIGNPNA